MYNNSILWPLKGRSVMLRLSWLSSSGCSIDEDLKAHDGRVSCITTETSCSMNCTPSGRKSYRLGYLVMCHGSRIGLIQIH